MNLVKTRILHGPILARAGRRALAASIVAFAAALSPLHAETYQFIISGDPVAAATVDSCSVASSATSLETATRSGKSAASSLEARFRTWLESLGRALRSDRFRGFFIDLR